MGRQLKGHHVIFDLVMGSMAIFINPLKPNAGESNGKLHLRTCPGCSVPEPYQSPD